MPWEICVPLIKVGKLVLNAKPNCITIPLVIPIPERPGPGPRPWLTGELIKKDFARDLQFLATIDELASGLSSGLRKQVQGTVRKLAKEAGTLPEGMELNFDKEGH
jgi:hypothetical protein